MAQSVAAGAGMFRLNEILVPKLDELPILQKIRWRIRIKRPIMVEKHQSAELRRRK